MPTFEEAGGGSYSADAWYDVPAPAGTPEPIVQALERAAAGFSNSESAAEKLHGLGLGLEPESECGAPFTEQVEREVAAYTQLALELGLKAE